MVTNNTIYFIYIYIYIYIYISILNNRGNNNTITPYTEARTHPVWHGQQSSYRQHSTSGAPVLHSLPAGYLGNAVNNNNNTQIYTDQSKHSFYIYIYIYIYTLLPLTHTLYM